MKNILITGGAGFIGSNFLKIILKGNYNIINVDNLSYASNRKIENIKNKKYFFYKININDKKKISKIFLKHKIDTVINFAAESHVDNSIRKPNKFVKTNILGTHNLLRCSYNYWLDNPFSIKKKFNNKCLFVQVSTDEVYGSTLKGKFSESSNLNPNSPYSASKAAADHLVNSYNRTFGLPTIITRCSNNFGPNQHLEKFIPKIIESLIKKKEIPVYGKGLNIREWIYVDDHCLGILKVIKNGKIGHIYNIGSNTEINNIKLVKLIIRLFNKKSDSFNYLSLIKFVKDRPGHDFRYSLNSRKIKKIGWKTRSTFKSSLIKTINFYENNIPKKI